MSMPTLRDVAERAGVHPGTVSRALNPQTRDLVRPETVTRVRRAVQALGYQPNPIARSLKTHRTMTVGIVIPDLTMPLFPPIVRGIEDALRPAGYSGLVINTDDDIEREAHLVASLRDRQVDGFVFSASRFDCPAIDRLAGDGVPVVVINRRLDSPHLSAVTSDDADGIEMAITHLVDLGHTEIAHIAGPRWSTAGQARLDAFRAGMAARGLDGSRAVQVDSWFEQQSEHALAALLDGPVFTAVIAGSDRLAFGCYNLMQKRRIACPRDLSVVGFSNAPLAEKIRPALTTVSVPNYAIGARAAHLLLDRIREPDAPPKRIRIPVSLVVRDSTAPAIVPARTAV
jgi:LacI family transcriptional regulator